MSRSRCCRSAFVTLCLLSGTVAQSAPRLVVDLSTGSIGPTWVLPTTLVGDGVRVAFRASLPGWNALAFVTDGTARGTRPLVDPNVWTYGLGEAWTTWVGGELWFTLEDPPTSMHPGLYPAVYDPSAGEVRRLVADPPGELAPFGFVAFGGGVAFATRAAPGVDASLWWSDGTPAGTFDAARSFGLPARSAPDGLVTAGGLLFLNVHAPYAARGLWRTDGTPAGTFRLAPVHAESPVEVSGRLWFVARDTATGGELWTSDGTVGGTHLAADVEPGAGSSDPAELLAVGPYVVFTAAMSSIGREVLAWDTTYGRLRYAGDLMPGAASSDPRELTAWNGQVAFVATDVAHGRELFGWSPGPGSARALVELAPGSASFDPRGLVACGRELWFSADDGVHGREPWRTDGSLAGARLVADLRSGAGGSDAQAFAAVGSGRVVFAASLDGARFSICACDGTAAGTASMQLLPAGRNDGSHPGALEPFRDGVLFGAASSPGEAEPWFVDAAGTVVRLLDLVAAPYSSVTIGAALEDRAFLATRSGPNGDRANWVTDGTANGTTRAPMDFSSVVRLGDVAVGMAEDPQRGTEPAVSDGTSAGTRLLTDATPGSGSTSLQGMSAVGERVWMRLVTYSPASRMLLYVTDGTPVGTRLVMQSSGGFGASFAALGDGTVLFSSSSQLYRSDGTATGTRALPGTPSGFLVTLRGRVLILADEPWITDGTVAGTSRIRDLRPGPEPSLWHRSEAVVARDRAFFVADDGPHGDELWATDGTAAGTMRLTDLRPGPDRGVDVASLRVVGDRVVFTGMTPARGAELWVTDGTLAGTRPLAELWPGPFSSILVDGTAPPLELAGDTVWFTADDGVHGRELFALPWRALGGAMAYGHGHGCAGAVGVPRLRAEGLPSVAAGGFALALDRAAPHATAAFLLGTQRANLSLGGGCSMLVGGVSVAVTARTDASGRAALHLAVPPVPSLLGAVLDAQAFVAGSGGAWNGIVAASPGLELVVGD